MDKYKSKYSLYFFDKKYQPQSVEKKWQEKWLKSKIFQPDLDGAKRPFYNLMMFPYPSAEGLHVGNMYAFTGADIYGRFKKQQGFDVFEPIGLDGFGIHSENYALKVGEHPVKLAKKTKENFYRQLHATGNAYAWDQTLETYEPDYYRWTQWIFVQMFKKGLAYRRKAKVNWCPKCKTTLADEQVTGGLCERCQTLVEDKEVEQWFFRITDYADRLLDGLEKIDWSERVKIAQRNWIGKSEGVEIEFPILPINTNTTNKSIKVFTTRPDTIYGATFMVLSPRHPLVAGKYKFVKKEADDTEKTGYPTGLYCLNPVNQEKIPVWVSDYVVGEYGTGAIMGVPAYDERDLEFAKKYNLPVKKVPLEDLREIMREIIEKGWGDKKIQYHLRDWCVSRQRYWGPPIPMVSCGKCGWVAVREKDLPVLLPQVEDWWPKGEGQSPLANIKEFVETTCPECGGAARRETDVSDTFLDSAWYYLRYPSIHSKQIPFDPEITKKWLPVKMYIGGAEHAVLHLMYSRFLAMVFHDWGLLDFEEPYTKFYAHGLLIAEGAKMSKSRGNVVIPDEYIKSYGADTLRCYLMFLGPFDQGGDFRDTGIAGMWRFLNRVWRLTVEMVGPVAHPRFAPPTKLESDLKRLQHQTIKWVTKDIEILRYNTALSKIMEYVNELTKSNSQLITHNSQLIETLVLLLAPFAPHLSEELWCEVLGNQFSVHQQPWPEYDPNLIQEETVTMIIEVNGKVREKLQLKTQNSKLKIEVEKLARENEKVKKYLGDRSIKQVIFVPGKLINFVT